jgi:hypothetical protein
LASVVNTCFTIIFGGSLLFVVFGGYKLCGDKQDGLTDPNIDNKPLGMFGLLHWLFVDRIRRQFADDFPNLHQEGGQPGDPHSGAVAFMRENMLDLGPVEEDCTSAQDYRHPGSKDSIETISQEHNESNNTQRQEELESGMQR